MSDTCRLFPPFGDPWPSCLLPCQVRLVKAMVFPVVMYGCESWTVKDEHRRIDAFELWCWRRLLRVPWTASRSNKSILKEISPGCSLKGLMLKLKLQYFGHLMRRVDSSINLSSEHSGLISLKIDQFDLLAVQGTFRSLLQHCSSNASIL